MRRQHGDRAARGRWHQLGADSRQHERLDHRDPTSGTSKGVLRVDRQAGQTCGAGQATLTWQQGSVCNSFPRPDVNLHVPGSTPGTGCDVHGDYLFAENLSGGDLTNANLSGTNLVQASMVGTKLIGTNLTGARSAGATNSPFPWREPHQRELHRREPDGRRSRRRGRGSSGVTLVGAIGLTSAMLRSIAVNNTNLFCGVTSWPSLTLANLTGLNLAGFNLSADFLGVANAQQRQPDRCEPDERRGRGRDLDHAKLPTNANLTCTDLIHVSTVGTTFTGAIWSNTTCPDGTNSDAHGNTCIGHL